MIGKDFQHEIKHSEYEIRMLKCAQQVRARMGCSLKTIDVPSCKRCVIRVNYADNTTPPYTYLVTSRGTNMSRYWYHLSWPTSTQDCHLSFYDVSPAFTVTIYSTRPISSLTLVSYSSDA